MNEKYYITTAIAYTSGKPHIGNTYEIVLADAIARFKRKEGYDVYFQTGTDEHGQKIQDKAAEKNIKPQEFVDEIAGEIKTIWDLMNTSYDQFVRTTDPVHKDKVSKIFKKLYEQGDIYKSKYEGWYCKYDELFITESQLVDGACPDCGREVQKQSEEAYFFKLSDYADRLVEHIENNPTFIQPESRKNEMINNFIKPGLQDLCVSRTSFDWGIPVTIDEGHVVYVWVDALSNYITFLGYDPDGNHSDEYKKYWPADVHLIGKDILRFHTIYWPIILMALGEELPHQVFGHPWLLVDGGKMSKSIGNVIYADDLVKTFGVDEVRYFLLHEMPFANDGVLTYELLIERINTELANVLGNLVNRTISMQQKYFGGEILAPTKKETIDDELIDLALKTKTAVINKMEHLKVADAISEIFKLLRRSNKYIDETTPWILGKDESQKERLGTVMYNLLESIRFAAVLLEPFLPETAEKIYTQINTTVTTFDSLNSFDGTVVGSYVSKPTPLFARLDKEKLLEELTPKVEAVVEEIPTVEFSDFEKVNIVVGQIEKCEKHPKADRLLVSEINIGTETRQIVSGISAYYSPKELVGKKVLVVTNLKPIKLRGVLSNGMVLAGSYEESLKLATIDDIVPNGTKIK